jgi:hypothetical protein
MDFCFGKFGDWRRVGGRKSPFGHFCGGKNHLFSLLLFFAILFSDHFSFPHVMSSEERGIVTFPLQPWMGFSSAIYHQKSQIPTLNFAQPSIMDGSIVILLL